MLPITTYKEIYEFIFSGGGITNLPVTPPVLSSKKPSQVSFLNPSLKLVFIFGIAFQITLKPTHPKKYKKYTLNDGGWGQRVSTFSPKTGKLALKVFISKIS